MIVFFGIGAASFVFLLMLMTSVTVIIAMYMKNNSSLLYSFILLMGDFVALVAAFSLAYVIRVKLDTRPLLVQPHAMTYLLIFLILLPFWLMIFGFLNMYKSEVYENRFSEAARIVVGSFIGILFLLSSEYITKQVIFPARLVPVYGFVISMLLVLLSRTILRAVRRTLFTQGLWLNSVLLVGNSPITSELVHSLSNSGTTGYEVAGVVAGKHVNIGAIPETHRYGSFAQALQHLKNKPPHTIVQTEFFGDPDKNDEILTYTQEHHIAYKFVPGNSEVFAGKFDVDLFQNIPVVSVHQTALIGWGRVAKRLFDVFVSLCAVLIASPIMLLIALYLLVFDHGHIIFKQARLTRFNTKFYIYKFRTVKHGYNMTPEEGFTKMGRLDLLKKFRDNGNFLPNDPRYGRFGNFLRATSLDELPQLFNVLKGDISLVGPRALIERDLAEYQHKNLILSVKSGITGLAQISGRNNIPFDERRRLDVFYVQNWSFWFDIVIISKTFLQITKRMIERRTD